MRIAAYRNAQLDGSNLAAVVEDIVKSAGVAEAEVTDIGSSIDLLDIVAPVNGEPLDLIVVPCELPGTSAFDTLAEARESARHLHAVVFDGTAEQAVLAAKCGVNEFLAAPLSRAALERVLVRQLAEIQALHAGSFVMATRKGPRRIAFQDVLYCETSGHDQIVHMLGNVWAIGRYPSQGLFDLIAGDSRFYKLGSSYIVNLNEVYEAQITNGSLTLTDGTALTIPSRLRKSFETALIARSEPAA